MRRRRHQRGAVILLGSLTASVAVHLLLGFPIRDAFDRYLSSSAKKADEPVRVVRLSADAWANSFAQAQAVRDRSPKVRVESSPNATDPKKPDAAKEPPKPKVEDKITGQIVEVPPTADDSPNPEAKYLSKYNSHVEKEMTARPEERDRTKDRVTHKLQTKDQPSASEDTLRTPGLSIRGDGLDTDREGKPAEQKKPTENKSGNKFVLEVPDLTRKDDVKLDLSELPGRPQARIANRAGTEAMRGNADQFRLEMGNGLDSSESEAGGKRGAKDGKEERTLPSLAALRPTIGTVARISGSPSNDYVEGLPEGDGTFLNAKEFKYATFFYRVKDSVAGYWEDLAAAEYRRRDPTGNIYGVRDRKTLLHIQLGRDGRLESVRIAQTSGVDFLDSVAVQAFRMAEPFPNPPPGIADEDGFIRFNFQFVVTMRSSSPLNLFR